MGFLERRWERRQAERPRTPQEQLEEAEQEKDAERARLEEELAPITVSTLSTADRPFGRQEVFQGDPCDNAAWAVLSLKQAVRDAGYDAVLGLGFCPVMFQASGDSIVLTTGAVLPGRAKLAQQLFAYGTGVKWLTEAD